MKTSLKKEKSKKMVRDSTLGENWKNPLTSHLGKS